MRSAFVSCPHPLPSRGLFPLFSVVARPLADRVNLNARKSLLPSSLFFLSLFFFLAFEKVYAVSSFWCRLPFPPPLFSPNHGGRKVRINI